LNQVDTELAKTQLALNHLARSVQLQVGTQKICVMIILLNFCAVICIHLTLSQLQSIKFHAYFIDNMLW